MVDKKDVHENILKLQKDGNKIIEQNLQHYDDYDVAPSKESNKSGMKFGMKKIPVGKRKGWMVW